MKVTDSDNQPHPHKPSQLEDLATTAHVDSAVRQGLDAPQSASTQARLMQASTPLRNATQGLRFDADAAVTTTARMLKSRGNVPMEWLSSVYFESSERGFTAKIGGNSPHAAMAKLSAGSKESWDVKAQSHESFIQGGVHLSLAHKGASGKLGVSEVSAAGELPVALFRLCEVLEREAAAQKLIAYFEEGGAQRLKAMSYALTRHKVVGVTPVLANADETNIRAVCLRRNQEIGFAGVVVDRTPEFAIVSAGTSGVLAFVPLQTFPTAQSLQPGDPVALYLSPSQGLRVWPIEMERVRDAVITASFRGVQRAVTDNAPSKGLPGVEPVLPEMPRVRAYLLHQFADKEKFFKQGEVRTVELHPSIQPPKPREGVDLLKLRKAWKPLDVSNLPGLEALLSSNGFATKSTENAANIEDKTFGAKEVRFRTVAPGELQVLAVFEDKGRFSVEALHLSTSTAKPLSATLESLRSLESAWAYGEKLAQQPLLARTDLGAKLVTAIQVKGQLATEAPSLATYQASRAKRPAPSRDSWGR